MADMSAWYAETIGADQALEQLAADAPRAALTMIFARKMTNPAEHVGEIETRTDYQGNLVQRYALPRGMGEARAWALCLSKASGGEVNTKEVRLWESGQQSPPIAVLAGALKISGLDMTAVAQWRTDLYQWSELMLALVADAPDWVEDEAMMPRLMRDAGSRSRWTKTANALAVGAKAMRNAERIIRLTLHDAERMRLLAAFEEEEEKQ